MFLCFFVLSVLIFVGNAELPHLDNVVFQNKCIEDLGCFYTGPPFYHAIQRPISIVPSDKLSTKFLLFTPRNPEIAENLKVDEKSVRDSFFDSNLPVEVLVHGYRAKLEPDDVRFQMKDAFLKIGDYNVIIVDWIKSDGDPYPQCVANARVVGAQLAKLLNLIIKSAGVRAADIHIVGHSVGAHLAGYTGERIQGLGRITGLDPAGPYFRDVTEEVRLDVTDALFVDIIHTNGHDIGFGLGDPIGHLDFYPNGGQRQPGCADMSANDATESAYKVTTQFICDHLRASHLFLESIDNSKCQFFATWCNSYADFEKGACRQNNSTLLEMGFHAKRTKRFTKKSTLFLATHSSSPFCITDNFENCVF